MISKEENKMEYVLLSKLFYQDREQQKMLYQKRYESESTYHFNFYVKEHPAFCFISKEIHTLCCDIYDYKSKLYGMIFQVPDDIINHFTKTCLIDEVKLTNEIEGVQSTRQEINALIEHLPSRKKNSRLYGLVKKYFLLSDINEEVPLNTCEDIRSLYDELCLPEVIAEDKNNAPDGKMFRKEMVNVLSPTQKPIHQGSYPENKIISEMEQALNILHDEKLPPLIRIAVFHYLFGYIHPFYDGNGRMNRFISSYFLSKEINPLVALRLSYMVKYRLKNYYDSFTYGNDPHNFGDLTPFIIEFLTIILYAQQDLLQRLEDDNKRFSFYLNQIENMIKSSDELKEPAYKILFYLLLNSLFNDRGISVDELAKESDISISTVRKYIKKFKEAGYLKISKESYNNLYDIDLNVLERYNDKTQ